MRLDPCMVPLILLPLGVNTAFLSSIVTALLEIVPLMEPTAAVARDPLDERRTTCALPLSEPCEVVNSKKTTSLGVVDK